MATNARLDGVTVGSFGLADRRDARDFPELFERLDDWLRRGHKAPLPQDLGRVRRMAVSS